jgi:hypothetical protein
MRRNVSCLLAALATISFGASPSAAKGPGKYTIAGTNSSDGSKYEGTTTLSKTGEDSWQVKQEVEGDKFEGYGIGDDDIIAVTFKNGDSAGVALYVSQPDGSYKGVWAFRGDAKVSTEVLKPQ